MKRFYKRNLSTNKNKDLIFGLTKNSMGKNRIKIDELEELNADTSFEVISLLQKNKDNRRFNIRHRRSNYDDDYIHRKDEIDKEEELKHRVPQHRRYLVHPTIGAGTPFQREKMKQNQRVSRAAANTVKYQQEKLGLIEQEAGSNILTRNTGHQLESDVEDKIQLSILKGEFDNLKNAGKQLNKYHNSLVDPTTDLAFEILKKNGHKPDWVGLQNQIYGLKEDIRARLKIELCRFLKSKCEIKIANDQDLILFKNLATNKFSEDELIINHKTDSYNLIAPSHFLTRYRLNLELEIMQVTKITFLNNKELDEMILKQTEISNTYENIRIASRFDINNVHNDLSIRPIYQISNNGNQNNIRYNGIYTSHSNDKTLSPGALTLIFFMKPIENLSNYLLKYI
jgi:hypothetical protein